MPVLKVSGWSSFVIAMSSIVHTAWDRILRFIQEFGLSTIDSRVAVFNGNFSTISQTGEGTIVQIGIPRRMIDFGIVR